MQDKESYGSSKTLVEIIARATDRFLFNGKYSRLAAEEILTAIKAAGMVIVPREPTEAMLNGARDWSVKRHGLGIGNDEATGCYRAMITAGEE